MAIYKFLRSADVSRVLVDRTVRVSSLDHFRRLEAGRQWIADRDEGSARLAIEHLNVVGGPDDPIAAATPIGFPPMFKTAPGVKWSISGISLVYAHPSVHIYSASRGDLAELQGPMSGDGYDACLRVDNLDLLARRLFDRGRIIELDSARMRELFSRVEVADVSYESMVMAPEAGRLPTPSPFRKDRAFEAQREVRIAFWPRSDERIPDVITVSLTTLPRFFTRMI